MKKTHTLMDINGTMVWLPKNLTCVKLGNGSYCVTNKPEKIPYTCFSPYVDKSLDEICSEQRQIADVMLILQNIIPYISSDKKSIFENSLTEMRNKLAWWGFDTLVFDDEEPTTEENIFVIISAMNKFNVGNTQASFTELKEQLNAQKYFITTLFSSSLPIFTIL